MQLRACLQPIYGFAEQCSRSFACAFAPCALLVCAWPIRASARQHLVDCSWRALAAAEALLRSSLRLWASVLPRRKTATTSTTTCSLLGSLPTLVSPGCGSIAGPSRCVVFWRSCVWAPTPYAFIIVPRRWIGHRPLSSHLVSSVFPGVLSPWSQMLTSLASSYRDVQCALPIVGSF